MGIEIALTDEEIRQYAEHHRIIEKPFYQPRGNEITLFENAITEGQAVALLGPTGCGKSRFAEYMAHKHDKPIFTISGFESVDAGEILGTPMATGTGTKFFPGDLYIGAKTGGYVHAEEILEMNEDVLPLFHGITDWRRRLTVKDTGEVIPLQKESMIIISMNPGTAYQKASKRFPKPSFIQRFVVIPFQYIRGEEGAHILHKETGIEEKIARKLNMLAENIDKSQASGQWASVRESAGYHALRNTALQIKAGTPPLEAIDSGISRTLTHDEQIIDAINDLAKGIFKG